MFKKLNEKLLEFKDFLRNYIHPFLAPFFTVMNYFSLVNTEPLRKTGWGVTFLIVSIVYFVISLGFAIYQVLKNTGAIKGI